MDSLDRYRGALLGLAAGDALGTTLEFSPPGTFRPIDDMVGGGPFHLEPGEWTDDTSMALCLAESLIESNEFDPTDQLARYLRWKRKGHHSSNGTCFDIGGTVAAALARFERFSEPWSGSTDEFSAGNGSIMRLAPVPLFFADDAKSTSFRHGALLAVNLGDDADTTGAVYGQLAGAYYGVEDIPEGWRSKLAHLDVLERFAKQLHERATGRVKEIE
jgi:ADP-ribosyl-[dinitrogen reductase] hydrolase